MANNDEIQQFLDKWDSDLIQAKPVFSNYWKSLESNPNLELQFVSRPGISYSLRAKKPGSDQQDVLCLIDVVDDDPANRWLSVCFPADIITDPEEQGDYVPVGLFGKDAICFNLDENNNMVAEYIFKRIKEATTNSRMQ